MYFIVGILMSYAFYGFVSFLISIFVLKIKLATMLSALSNLHGFPNIFYAFMVCSLPALIVFSILHYLISWIDENYINVIPEDWRKPYLDGTLGRIETTILNPIKGLLSPIGARSYIDSFDLYGIYCWIQVILHFISSVFLIGFIGYGFYSILH